MGFEGTKQTAALGSPHSSYATGASYKKSMQIASQQGIKVLTQ